MIEKSLLQVYTDLHPRLSPKYTIRGNVLSLSVEGGPCRRWRDAGQHTCLHAHTHAYTSHTQSHTAAASLWWVLAHWRVPGGSWPALGVRWAQAQHPCGVTLLLPAAQVLGSGRVELGKGPPKPLGRPCSLLLICVLGQPALLGLLQNEPGEEG